MASEVLDEDAADVFLRGSWGWAIVVSQIEVGHAAVKRAVHDASGLLEIIVMTEIVPKS
jgi:hypothetical protein